MQIFGKEHHHNDNPWQEAPPWALELGAMMVLIIKNQEKIMAAIDDLEAAVAAEDTVIDSAIVLINGIPALIAAAGTDPARLAALQTDIAARAASLAAAVAANTLAAPAPTPPTT